MRTATATPTATGTILAIDLGRYKSVACAYDRGTMAARFHTIESTRADVERLFARYPEAVVVVEACANAGWVHDLAIEHGLAVKVANTNGEAWKFKHLKRKTDRDDAQRFAELEALGQLPTVVLPDPATRQRRATVAGWSRQNLPAFPSFKPFIRTQPWSDMRFLSSSQADPRQEVGV
jgi:transposase